MSRDGQEKGSVQGECSGACGAAEKEPEDQVGSWAGQENRPGHRPYSGHELGAPKAEPLLLGCALGNGLSCADTQVPRHCCVQSRVCRVR